MLIGEVARRSGVSARMLRHYDRIGLLSPSARTAGGYRRYTEADVRRLFHVESLRSLGVSLAEIATTLDATDFTPEDLIRRLRERATAQRDTLVELLTRLDRVQVSEPRSRADLLGIVELMRGLDARSASGRQRLALAPGTAKEGNVAVLVDAVLREKDANTAGALLWSIARIGDPAVSLLAEALASDEHLRRTRALEGLVKIATPRSLAIVAAQTAHPDALLRARAHITAARMGDESRVEPLIALVAAGEWDADAGDALEALAQSSQVAARIAHQADLARSTADIDGRRRLAGMLAAVPGAEADAALSLLAADADRAVAMTARSLLEARSRRNP